MLRGPPLGSKQPEPDAPHLRGRHSGRIAQLVEQLTLNQRVQGSSPCAPTNFPFERDKHFRSRACATNVVMFSKKSIGLLKKKDGAAVFSRVEDTP
jgi:hypothetical protein